MSIEVSFMKQDDRNRAFSLLLPGLFLGALVLGLAGRFVTAGVAALSGGAAHLSANGLVQSVAAGMVVGAAGALLLVPVRSLIRAGTAARGFVLGFVLFAASLALALSRGWIAWGSGVTLPRTLAVVAPLYVVYGLLLDAAANRLGRQTARRHSRS